MPDFLASAVQDGGGRPLEVVARLVVAMVLGWVVQQIYRRTRGPAATAPSFAVTLVLLSILIAMVTQVIGDNVARAFSLVGALSIVRFRTVVRDTQDTAYVIFAVAVGMAVGAGHGLLAVAGIGVVGLAAFLMRTRAAAGPDDEAAYVIQVRTGLGHDPEQLVGGALDAHLLERRLESMATARQGMALEGSWRGRLRSTGAAAALVTALNRIDGVQSVSVRREGAEES
jgi:hypothetical protein